MRDTNYGPRRRLALRSLDALEVREIVAEQAHRFFDEVLNGRDPELVEREHQQELDELVAQLPAEQALEFNLLLAQETEHVRLAIEQDVELQPLFESAREANRAQQAEGTSRNSGFVARLLRACLGMTARSCS